MLPTPAVDGCADAAPNNPPDGAGGEPNRDGACAGAPKTDCVPKADGAGAPKADGAGAPKSPPVVGAGAGTPNALPVPNADVGAGAPKPPNPEDAGGDAPNPVGALVEPKSPPVGAGAGAPKSPPLGAGAGAPKGVCVEGAPNPPVGAGAGAPKAPNPPPNGPG